MFQELKSMHPINRLSCAPASVLHAPLRPISHPTLKFMQPVILCNQITSCVRLSFLCEQTEGQNISNFQSGLLGYDTV
jgi:hypothetical protein